MSLSQNNGTFVDGLNNAIRENPLAATLVGAGVCWMLLGGKAPFLRSTIPHAIKNAGDSLGSAARRGGKVAGDAVESMREQVVSTASQVTNTVRDAADGIKPDAAYDTMASAGEKLLEGVRSTAKTGQRYGNAAQQRLAENLERQPLLLGALGLAIGAGIASAFASTKLENSVMGAGGTELREKITALAGEAKDFALSRGQEVLDEVRQEAQRQGLTSEAARNAAGNISQKVQTVTNTASEATGKRIS